MKPQQKLCPLALEKRCVGATEAACSIGSLEKGPGLALEIKSYRAPIPTDPDFAIDASVQRV